MYDVLFTQQSLLYLLVCLLVNIIQEDKCKQSAVSLHYNTYIQGIVQGETV